MNSFSTNHSPEHHIGVSDLQQLFFRVHTKNKLKTQVVKKSVPQHNL